MLGVFLFVPAVALIVLGIMYITGKGLKFINSDTPVSEEEVVDYVVQRNPVNNCKFFGIMMLIAAAYCITVAVSILISNTLITTIATLVAAVIAAVAAIYYYTARVLKSNGGKNNGRNKNVKN